MYFAITVIATLQAFQHSILSCLHRARRKYLLPIAKHGGRDMLYLKNGMWIDDASGIPPCQIKMRYDSEKHTVFSVERPTAPIRRISWLSVTSANHDMSEFFNDLRISDANYLPNEARIMLFAHQNGWFPTGPFTVIRRDGSIEKIHLFTNRLVEPMVIPGVNYVF